jgi:hypothetical protein
MNTNENKTENERSTATANGNSSNKSNKSNNRSANISKIDNQEKDNNSGAIDDLSIKLKQKKREAEQLAINPNDILEELEKRQPLCQQE